MEKLVKEGKTRSIDVSNFTILMLEDLLSKCEIPPAANEVEILPSFPQEELLAYCKGKNIVLTGYSSLGTLGYMPGAVKTLEEPVVTDIAKNRIRDILTFFEMEDMDIEAITALGRENPIRTWKPEGCFGLENAIFD